jgi:membrane fusion protein (multidrug efflux system)
VFVIGQKAPLRVELEIDEEDIARVQIGQKVLISADAFPRQSFASSIATITPQGDSDSKSYRARALLSAETPLPVGMTVEANVVLAEHQNALLVPAEAVVKRAGKDVVFVVEGSHARQTVVEVGIRGASFDEILSGVAEGQMLVRAPGDKLADGARINPAGD